MSSICLFFEGVNPLFDNDMFIQQGLNKLIKAEQFTLSSLNYIFCTDEYLYQINLTYLSHDYYTDVITFNNAESPQIIDGDIFISIDRVLENAKNNNVSFLNELYRVMIHGLLHLVGFDDTSDDLSVVMRQKENIYLTNFVV